MEANKMTEIIEKKPESLEEIKLKTTYKVNPHYYTDFDYKSREISIEIHLPGVPKKNIKLRILPKFWYLKAFREEEKSKADYTVKEYFPIEINPDSTKAEFKNGLLKFTAKIKNPLDDAIEIKLK